MNYKELSLMELLLSRQWIYSVSGRSAQQARQLADAQLDVDKELWQRLISDESPWEGSPRYFKQFTDDKFEETINSLRDGYADIPEDK